MPAAPRVLVSVRIGRPAAPGGGGVHAPLADYRLTADLGQLALSLRDAGLGAGRPRRMAVTRGAFSLAGGDIRVGRSYRLAANPAAGFRLTGFAAGFGAASPRRLSAALGGLAMLGRDAGLRVGRRAAAAGGQVNVTGSAVGASRPAGSYTLTAVKVGFSLSGVAAGLGGGSGRRLVVTRGSFALTLSTAGPQVSRTLTAAKGAVTLSGSAVSKKLDRRLTTARASLTLSTPQTGLRTGRAIHLSRGVFTLTGSAAGGGRNSRNVALTAAKGTLTLTGRDAGLTGGPPHRMTATRGAFSLAGSSASLRYGHAVPAAKGAFALSGQAATLKLGRKLLAAKRAVSLSGQPVILRYTPPAPNTVTLDFVGDSYFNGSLADILVNGAAATRTASGIAITTGGGAGVGYIYANALRPANWTAAGSSSWAAAPAPTSATWPNARRFVTSSGQNTGNAQSTLTEGVTAGQTLIIQMAARYVSGQNASGIMLTLSWSGGSEYWYTNDFSADNPSWITYPGGGQSGIYSSFLGSTSKDAEGFKTLSISHTVQDPSLQVWITPVQPGGVGGGALDIGGLQVVRGAFSPQAWIDVGASTVGGGGASAYAFRPSSSLDSVLQSAAGWIGFEVNNVPYANMGMAALSGSVGGTILNCNGANTIQINAATEVKTSASANPTPLGLGGWRGIVRVALGWSADGSWSLCANGGPVLSGASGLSHTGANAILQNMSGSFRRVEASGTRLSDANLQAWTDLKNKTFATPGSALVPGVSSQTFFDDFDVNSLRSRTSAAPWSDDAQNHYAQDASHVKNWIPRQNYYTRSALGSIGPEIVNGERQSYLDPESGSGIVTHEFGVAVQGRPSYFRGTTYATSSLPPAQQAFVPINPSTGARYTVASWVMTSYGTSPNTDGFSGGGFNQRFGIFSSRCKMPTQVHGPWPAWWLYNYSDTSELDIQEQQGQGGSFGGPSIVQGALHWDNFADGNQVYQQFNAGFGLASDFHDYTAVWVAGSVKIYLDGVQVCSLTPGGSFDAHPKGMLLNVAVPGSVAAPNPADLPVQMYVDWVRVLQFG